jgi:hypothetical protein
MAPPDRDSEMLNVTYIVDNHNKLIDDLRIRPA